MATNGVEASGGEVGFIGIGIMGRGMAANLIRKANRTVVVWNRTKAAADALAAEFPAGSVVVAATAGEVARRCALTYSMLSTLEASEAVFPEVLAQIGPGKTVVDSATLTVERMQHMAAAVRARGGAFLEAPVSGSKGPAEAGQLVFLTAGDDSAAKLSSTDLAAMGKRTFYFGPEIGKATKVKLVNNMIMAVQLSALAEGIALCEASDISPDDLVAVLDQGAMSSPLLRAKGAAMITKQFAPQFPLKHAQKDLRFALEMGDRHAVPLPVTSSANEQFKRARARFGDEDCGAVVEVARVGK